MAEKVEIDQRFKDRPKVIIFGQYAFHPPDNDFNDGYRYEIAKAVSELFKTTKSITFCGELREGGTLTVRFKGNNFPYAFRKKMAELFPIVKEIVSKGIDEENKAENTPFHIEIQTSDDVRRYDPMYVAGGGEIPTRRNPYFYIDWYESWCEEPCI